MLRLRRCKLFYIGFLLIAALLMMTGCEEEEPANSTNVGGVGCTPVDYNNGVYYFPCRKAEFANGVSKFLADNPNAIVTATTGNGTSTHGYDDGYFVFVTFVNGTDK